MPLSTFSRKQVQGLVSKIDFKHEVDGAFLGGSGCTFNGFLDCFDENALQSRQRIARNIVGRLGAAGTTSNPLKGARPHGFWLKRCGHCNRRQRGGQDDCHRRCRRRAGI